MAAVGRQRIGQKYETWPSTKVLERSEGGLPLFTEMPRRSILGKPAYQRKHKASLTLRGRVALAAVSVDPDDFAALAPRCPVFEVTPLREEDAR
jgi:hypothetical protein